MLDAQRLEQAVEALSKARKIIFVGVGGGAAICDEAAHLFLKAGFDAASYRDGYTQTIIAAKLTQDDVVVGISLHRQHPHRVRCAAAGAGERGDHAGHHQRLWRWRARPMSASRPGGRASRWCRCMAISWKGA